LSAFNLSVGSHSLPVIATDNSANLNTATQIVHAVLSSPAPDTNTPPIVAITSPAGGEVFTTPTNILITATASDSDGIATVEFIANSAPSLGVDFLAPYSVAWVNPPAGNHTVRAIATDALGATATNAVSFRVNAPPGIQITHPVEGMIYPPGADVPLGATATDDALGVVNQVAFSANGSLLGLGTGVPLTSLYQFLWLDAPVGTNSLSARATDNDGVTSTSQVVRVFVGAKNSPLGTWEVTLSKADKGTAFITFHDDFTWDGYGVRASVPGVVEYAGTWGVGLKGIICGPAAETNDLGIIIGTHTNKVTAGKSLSGKLQANDGRQFGWKGKPAVATPDLAGTWNILSRRGVISPELLPYRLVATPDMPGVFEVREVPPDNEAGEPVGEAIVNRSNKLTAHVQINGTTATLTGTYTPKKRQIKLTGKDGAGQKITITVIR